MTWLTWRQFRTPAVVVFAALAAVAAGLAITGQHLASLYHTYGNNFLDQFSTDSSGRPMFFLGTAVVYALPAVIGAFWGAPLVARELEAGTHKLIWNQSITRNRWLANKFGLIGLAAVGAGLVSLAMTWWCGPIDKVINAGTESDEEPFVIPRLSSTFFGGRGIVPIGYAVFALAAGITIGLVLRRTVAAMAVTLVVVAVVQILVPLAVVPHLLAPVTTSVAINPKTIRTLAIHQEGGPIEDLAVKLDSPGAWITANESVNSSGKISALPDWTSDCVGIPGQNTPKTAACFARLAKEGYHQRVQYLPANRYWPLQWLVTAILLGLSLLSAGFSFWWLRNRLT